MSRPSGKRNYTNTGESARRAARGQEAYVYDAGYGYMDEYPISRAWRDSRVQRIYGGTNEIMKELIGRFL